MSAGFDEDRVQTGTSAASRVNAIALPHHARACAAVVLDGKGVRQSGHAQCAASIDVDFGKIAFWVG